MNDFEFENIGGTYGVRHVIRTFAGILLPWLVNYYDQAVAESLDDKYYQING